MSQFNPMQPVYGAHGDAVLLTDAFTTSGHGIVSSVSYVFTSADIGKYIAVQGAGTAGADFTPVLINGIYTDGVSATTSGVVPPTVVSGARCIFGHDDTAAVIAAEAAAEAAGGGEVEITKPHMLVTRTSGGGISWCIGVGASHMRFKFRGKGKIYHPEITGGVFLVVGNGKAGAITSWASNRYIDATQYAISSVTQGAISVTCTTAANAGNFASGDWLYLFTGDPAGSPSTAWYGTDSETFQVVSANASTGVITLSRPTGKAYAQEYWPTSAQNSPTTTSSTAWPAPFGITKVTDRTISDIEFTDMDVETWSCDRNVISSWQIEDMRIIRPKGRGYCGYATGRDRTGYHCESPRWRHVATAQTVNMPYADCWAAGDTDWTRTKAKITADSYPPYLHCHEGGVRCCDDRPSQMGASNIAAVGGSGAGHEFVGRWYNCEILDPKYGLCQYGVFCDSLGAGDQLTVRKPTFLATPGTATVRTGAGINFDTDDSGGAGIFAPANLGSAISSGSDRGRVRVQALSIDMAFNTGSRSLSQLPQFAVVVGVIVIVYSQFNGAPTLSLGISGDAARYMDAFTIPTTAPSVEGSVVAAGAPGFGSVPAGTGTAPGVIPPSRSTPLATLAAVGATQGKLKLIVEYILGGPSQ